MNDCKPTATDGPQDPTPTAATPTPISRREFLNALDFEIARQRADNQRPGWSSWALWGTLSVLAWMLSNDFDLAQFEASARLAIAFELMFFAFLILFNLASPNPKNLIGLRRFGIARTQLVVQRQYYTVGIIIFAGYTLASISLSEPPAAARHLATAQLALACIITILALLSSFIPAQPNPFLAAHKHFGLDKNIKKIGAALFLLFLVGVPASTAAALISTPLSPTDSPSRAVQIALLSFGVIRVMFRIAEVGTKNPIVSAMCDLRTEVARHRISVPSASKMLDTLTSGLTTSQILQDEAAGVVDLITAAHTIIRQAADRLDRVIDPAGDLVDMDRSLRQAILDAVEGDIPKIRDAIGQAMALHTKLLQTAMHIVNQGGELEAASTVLADLRPVVNELDGQFADVQARFQFARLQAASVSKTGIE